MGGRRGLGMGVRSRQSLPCVRHFDVGHSYGCVLAADLGVDGIGHHSSPSIPLQVQDSEGGGVG